MSVVQNQSEEKPESEEKAWYVVRTETGFEKQVVHSIKELARVDSEIGTRIGEVLVPVEEVVEMRQGKRRKAQRKFFPGYVLIHMAMNDEVWHKVRSVSRVLGFIGGSRERPVPISAKEADAILSRMKDVAGKLRPKVLFEPGEVVRVVSGPFSDFKGVVEKVNYEKNRIRVAVLIFGGRSTPVDLEFDQVEKT